MRFDLNFRLIYNVSSKYLFAQLTFDTLVWKKKKKLY